MKRIALFAGTNIAVLLVLSIALKVFGIESYLQSQGLYGNTIGMLIIAAVMGMSGSIISLLMSKSMAKRGTGAHVIEQPRNKTEQWLVDTVARQAKAAGIGMPEVAIYDAPEINAFATGAKRDDALVAVSTGLLRSMSEDEAEAVLAHEVSHVANGDMVTLALIQGVVNTFVFFFARIIGQLVDRVIFKSERGYGPGAFIATMVAQVVLGVLASMIVMWFSRWREFHADEGGAKLAGRHKMIAALERLSGQHNEHAELPEDLQAFGISGGSLRGSLAKLFGGLMRSHPPLPVRIAALRSGGDR